MAVLDDLLSTRPSVGDIQSAAALCSLTTGDIPSGFVGISQPQRFGMNRLTNREIDRSYELGAKSVRMEIQLSSLYYLEGVTPDWRAYDAAIDRIQNHGMSVLAIITYLPTWLAPDWAVIDTAFQSMCTEVLTHLNSKGVTLIECFNEPNLTGFGWLLKPDDLPGIQSVDFLGPYFLLQCRMNKIARDINSDFIILNGGLNNVSHEWSCSVQDWFTGLAQVNAQNSFDVLAFHPYGLQGQFGAGRTALNAFLNAVSKPNTPVWYNEYGWTDTASMDMLLYPTSDTNPMLKIIEQLDTCDAYYHFNICDYSLQPGTPTFGLCDYYGRKRPGFITLKQGILNG